MAWGYEAHFIIEHDNTLKRRIDCKDCCNYDSSDKSCLKTPRYLPEDGYNSWRYCNHFELKSSTSHYEEKKLQFIEWSNRMARKEIAEHKKTFSKKVTSVKGKSSNIAKQSVVKNSENKRVKKISHKECKALILREYLGKPISFKNASNFLLDIYLDDGRKKNVQLFVVDGFAYINKDSYPEEYMWEVRRIFKKK